MSVPDGQTGAGRLPGRLRGGAVAIVRGGDGSRTADVCAVLIDAGVPALEVTTNTPGAFDLIGRLAAQHAGAVLLGAGTVMTPDHVEATAAAGGTFVVSPHVDEAVGRRAAELGLHWYPGAMTPTEIVAAWRAGAAAVKVFPIAALGGPAYLAQVRAPLHDVDLVPTGGIGIDAAVDYLAAGAAAVGIGSPLIGDALAGGSRSDLAARAERLVSSLAAWRER